MAHGRLPGTHTYRDGYADPHEDTYANSYAHGDRDTDTRPDRPDARWWLMGAATADVIDLALKFAFGCGVAYLVFVILRRFANRPFPGESETHGPDCEGCMKTTLDGEERWTHNGRSYEP